MPGFLTVALGVVAALVLLGFIAVPIALVMIHNSAPWKLATEYGRRHAFVRRKIGRVVRIGWFPTGSFDSAQGVADFSLTLLGDQGRGKLHVALRKEGGAWVLKRAEFDVAGDRVVLLDELSGEGTSAPA